MLTPLVKPKITGVLLFAIGIILICFGILLHFVIPVILENINLLNDNQQHLMTILSGTLGSILTGGLVALGMTDIIIAVGVIKRKKIGMESSLGIDSSPRVAKHPYCNWNTELCKHSYDYRGRNS